MRNWLLIAGVTLLAVLVAFAFPSDGSAGLKSVTVVITATGPSRSTVTINPNGEVLFVNRDSVAHTVVVRQNEHARWTCPLGPAGAPSGGDHCAYSGGFVSRHAYTVDGQFAGKVVVAGLPRSVSLTARRQMIAPGKQLTLHGQITFEGWPANQSEPNCTFPFALTILTRHGRSQPFKRIAYFPVRPTNGNPPATRNRCTYVWQRNVRPGVATTYIARVTGVARVWRLATSRPFTVLIRR